MITVGYFATIREFTGVKEESMEQPATVLALMLRLGEMYGKPFRDFCIEEGNISRRVNVLVNGKHIHHLQEGDTPLAHGDGVSIFPLIGGG